jgi:hypothetical protein
MTRRTGAALGVLALLLVACAPACAEDSLRAFVGTWEGELHIPRSSNPSGRTLVLRSTGGALEAYYGISGRKLSRVTLATALSGSIVTLGLSTSAGGRIELTLEGDKTLVGTWQSPDPRNQRPIRFIKTQ